MAKLIRTKNVGEVREIRRTTRIDIQSPVNAPVNITATREMIVCDSDDAIISQKFVAAFTKTIPGVESEVVTLPGDIELTAAQVAKAVELFVEKWDEELLQAEENVKLEALAAAQARNASLSGSNVESLSGSDVESLSGTNVEPLSS